MTDITELAQSWKTAAHKAKQANDLYLEGKITLSECVVETKDYLDYSDNPNNFLALVEALELKEEQRANWFQMAQKLGEDLDAAEKRIAELESRTVTVEPFRSFVTDADLAALHRFAECCDDPESGGHDLQKEQVRRLEEIGALRRSGRVHWITGFGDVLISITDGIKWEAE